MHCEWQAAALRGLEPGAELLERRDHPAHRPLRQRSIADAARRQWRGCHQTHGKADAGARIAEIERRPRRGEAGDTHALHPPQAIFAARRCGPQGGHGLGAVEHVLGLEQALDAGFADGHGAQHQGPVRNRLVAGNPDHPLEPGDLAGDEWNRLILSHVCAFPASRYTGRPRLSPLADHGF
jgi:hypothetical protein